MHARPPPIAQLNADDETNPALTIAANIPVLGLSAALVLTARQTFAVSRYSTCFIPVSEARTIASISRWRVTAASNPGPRGLPSRMLSAKLA